MTPAPEAIHLSTEHLTVPEEADFVIQRWAERIDPVLSRKLVR